MSYVNSARRALRRQREAYPLVLLGCISGIARERLAEIPDIVPLTRGALEELDNLIAPKVIWKDVPEVNVFAADMPTPEECFTIDQRLSAKFHSLRQIVLVPTVGIRNGSRRLLHGQSEPSGPNESRFLVRVATGCLSECSYCAIRFASGPLHSKPLDKIVGEFQSGLSQGYTEFELIGEDIGAYGRDLGSTVVDLLDRLLRLEGNFSIHWTDFGTQWLIEYFPQMLALLERNKSKIGSMGFPVQSGSDQILTAMKREYSSAMALECLRRLRTTLPNARMTTHMIVGFPGETHGDFKRTVEFVRSASLDSVVIYLFSSRSGTVADSLDRRVNEICKCLRYWRLERVARSVRPPK